MTRLRRTLRRPCLALLGLAVSLALGHWNPVAAATAEAARAALEAAELAVVDARARAALWLEAPRALAAARAACGRGEFDECIRQSERAQALCALGILQLEHGTGPPPAAATPER